MIIMRFMSKMLIDSTLCFRSEAIASPDRRSTVKTDKGLQTKDLKVLQHAIQEFCGFLSVQ